MKISPLTPSVGYVATVREKQDGGSSHQDQSEQRQPGSDRDSRRERRQEANSENVGKAVEDFHTEFQTQVAGLNACVEGSGPGLKVILKDGTGSVVRQFTGEEFLRLREAASGDGRVVGKILDQKL